MEANPILLQKKYARLIENFAVRANIDARQALDFFYRSFIYKEMSKGISDMHCRSDAYLTEELMEEYNEAIKNFVFDVGPVCIRPPE